MALIECPECSKEQSDSAERCMNCGYAIEKHFSDPNNLYSVPEYDSTQKLKKRHGGFWGKGIVCHLSHELNPDFNFTHEKCEITLYSNGIQAYLSSTFLFDQIVDCRIVNTKTRAVESKSVIGRGIVGGLLFGGAGAVVGGLSGQHGRETFYSYVLSIVVHSDDKFKVLNLQFSGHKELEYAKLIVKKFDDWKGGIRPEENKNFLNLSERDSKILIIIGIVFLPYIFSWFTLNEEKWSMKSRIAAFSWLLILIVFNSVNDDKPASNSTKTTISTSDSINPTKLTLPQQKKVCEAYIAKVLGKNRAIMSSEILKEEYGNSFIKVFYTRTKDNTRWETLCTYQKDHLLWASLENGVPGRWRFEEEATLKAKGSSILVNVPKMGIALVSF